MPTTFCYVLDFVHYKKGRRQLAFAASGDFSGVNRPTSLLNSLFASRDPSTKLDDALDLSKVLRIFEGLSKMVSRSKLDWDDGGDGVRSLKATVEEFVKAEVNSSLNLP